MHGYDEAIVYMYLCTFYTDPHSTTMAFIFTLIGSCLAVKVCPSNQS